jgi:hypothetical protein
MAKSSQVADATLTRFSRHDKPQNLATTFKVPTDAAGIHDRNDNITYQQTFGVYGVNLNIGLPACECDPPTGYRFSHAVGLMGGAATYDLDASSRRDQRREAFQRSGVGGAFGVDYTATITQTPTESVVSRLGGRFHASWLYGDTDLATPPPAPPGCTATPTSTPIRTTPTGWPASTRASRSTTAARASSSGRSAWTCSSARSRSRGRSRSRRSSASSWCTPARTSTRAPTW